MNTICPNCTSDLVCFEGTDYDRLIKKYRCHNCDTFFTVPLEYISAKDLEVERKRKRKNDIAGGLINRKY